MISYLSRPIAPGTIPSQEPIELIAQAAQQKQHRYDTVQQAVLAQYQNLLNLDASSNALQQNRYNALMSQATKDLESLAKLDLMNPDNISKVESVFSPILNDTNIMTAVAETRKTQKEKAIWDNLKLKGSDKYSAENERFWAMKKQENYNMGEEFITKRNQDGVVFYKDVPKKIQDQLLKLPQVKTVSVNATDGWIVTLTNNQTKSIDEMMDYIQLDADDLAQARINAWSEAPNTSGEYYVEKGINRIQNSIKIYEQINRGEQEGIKLAKEEVSKWSNLGKPDEFLTSAQAQELKKKGLPYDEKYTVGDVITHYQNLVQDKEAAIKKNAEGISNLQSHLGRYQKELGVVINDDNTLSFNAPLDNATTEALRTQDYVQSLKEVMAKGHYKTDQTIEFKRDDYYFENVKFNNDLVMKQLEAQQALIKLQAEADLKGASQNSGTPGTPGSKETLPSLVPLVGNEGIPENYDKSTFDANRASVQDQLDNFTNQYIQDLYETDANTLGQMTPEEQSKYEQEAAKKLKLVEDALKSPNAEGQYVIGGVPLSKEELQQKYSKELETLSRKTNLEATLSLYDEIENTLERAFPNMKLNESAKKMLVEEKKITTVFSTGTGRERYNFNIPVNLDPVTLSEVQSNPNFNITNSDVIERLYKFNQDNNKTFSLKFNNLRQFKESIDNGYYIGEATNLGNNFIKPFDRLTSIEKEYSKLAEIQIPKAFGVKPGTDMRKAFETVAKAYKILTDDQLADSNTDFALISNPQSLSGFDIKVVYGGDKPESRIIPLSKELTNEFKNELEQLQGIQEIDQAMLLLQRSELAKTSPGFELYAIPRDKPVVLQYQGEIFEIQPDSPGAPTVTVLHKNSKLPLEKRKFSGIPYTGNNGVSNAIMFMLTEGQGQSKLSTYLDMTNQLWQQAKR